MKRWWDFEKRSQSFGEEVANSISHGLGLIAALAGAPFLLVRAQGADGATAAGAWLFALSMVLLYLASTLYHALPRGRAKRLFKTVEHSAIYLLIAGTYSPIALGVLRGPWGWTLFGLIWTLAVCGVLLKVFGKLNHSVLSTCLYLLMGWLVVVALGPLARRLSAQGVAWLVAGGLCYSLGVVFFAFDARIKYGHFIWHLFVLAGTFCHFGAIYWHAIA